jgi:phage baseplate assembly protein W
MAGPLYRSWRFLHPDFDDGAGESGLLVSRSGGIAMVEEHASVRQAILLLLTTKPGERLMRPDYGCDLHRLVFAPNDATTHGLAIHYVRQALLRWEPRIDILRLDAACSESDPGRVDILLEYRLRRTLHRDTLVIPFSLTREER